MKDPIGYIKKPDLLVVVFGDSDLPSADVLQNAAKAVGANPEDASASLPGSHAFSKVAIFEVEGRKAAPKPRTHPDDADLAEEARTGMGAEIAQRGARNFFKPRRSAGKNAEDSAPKDTLPGSSDPKATTDYTKLLTKD